jgi:16S rRNA G1207 methylase RsmC
MNTKKLKNVEVRNGNMYDAINEKFDVILLNPPQTAGKDVCFEMIEKAKHYLVKNGSLQIVARHNKGGKTLMQKMKEVFNNVETLAKKSGYRVYISRFVTSRK